jgi:hypothetical protein
MADSTIDRILRLRRLGMNNQTIASILGISSTQVSNMLKDPTIADPVSGAQTSRSVYMGDVTIVNPANPDVEVPVGAALTIAPGHPLLADIGVFASIDPTIPSRDVIANNGVVGIRLKALVGGVEVPDFEDWLSLDNDEGRYWAKSSQVLTDKTVVLQVIARFLQGTQPSFNVNVKGPDFKLTTQHFNADNTDFVNHMTGTLSHGVTAADMAAALNAVNDEPGVFTVVQSNADNYVVTAPHKYNQMDVVNAATGVYDAAVGGVIPGDYDIPDAPQSVTLQDVSIFYGSA